MTATIRAIDNDSVHRLHAGQVVLELQGAIKELVENSLDAGASSIDVRIKDHGLDTIEVADNGSGIAEADWAYIGLKHHTSKLPSLSELPNITTFGFHGEALGSLCALCESVQVVTATKETAPMGAVIKLSRDGRVIDSSGRIARPRGTTITLSGLFVPLPVRRKEFERTAKREFTKALTMLYAYALVPASVSTKDGRTGVRLKVESLAAGKGGKRSVILATDGRGSVRSSVTSIWGSKALEGVLDLNLGLEVEIDSIMARREGLPGSSQIVTVSGLISSAQWGQGRSSPDRQFYYINGRPCDLKQVGRAVNEVYKSFNTNQVPLAILDFRIPPESVDINVSPDKRTIFLHSEANLVLALRTALEQFFTPSRSAYALEGASSTVKLLQTTQTQLQMTDSPATAENMQVEDDEDRDDEINQAQDDSTPLVAKTSRRSLANGGMSDGTEEVMVEEPHSEDVPAVNLRDDSEIIFEGEVEIIPPRTNSRRRPPSPSPPLFSPPRRTVRSTIDTTTASWSPGKKQSQKGESTTQSRTIGAEKTTRKNASSSLREKLAGFASQTKSRPSSLSEYSGEDGGSDQDIHLDTDQDDDQDIGDADQENDDTPLQQPDPEEDLAELGADEAEEVDELEGTPIKSDLDEPQTSSSTSPSRYRLPRREANLAEAVSSSSYAPRHETTLPSRPSRPSSYRDEISSSNVLGEATLHFDVAKVRTRYASRSRYTIKPQSAPRQRDAYAAMAEGGVAKAAGISNRDAAQAEEALSRVISKPDFERMEVIGQFNKGFIIARLRTDDRKGKGRQSDDLFIIDQHASDEKFNFETLQRTTVIKAQTLIKLRPLQLTAGDELVAMENLDVLKANGFEVKVDEEKAPGRGERISLAAMPVSKETTFDFKDLEQLLHLLSDGARPAGQMVRCTKARSMFAMRACRRSVMIGKSLTKGQMIQLLRNMGTIDQPWNCPHGRPTMRHLIKIEASTKSRSGRDRVDWAKWKLQEV